MSFFTYLLAVLELILLIWAIVDIIKTRPKRIVLWTIICILFPIVGSIVYFQWKHWSKINALQSY